MADGIEETRTILRMMCYPVSETGILRKKSECSYQESNLRLSEETRGS